MSARSREPRKAVISVGTNSTRALVVEFDPLNVLLSRSTGTRIGEGLHESGWLSEDGMRRTLDAIEEHVAAVGEFQPALRAIATSALRRADNAGDFIRAVETIAGVSLQIISGEEEARCSYEGAISGLPAENCYGVLDVGGGSSEYATRDAWISLEIGAVRLTERFPALREMVGSDEIERARAEVRNALRPLAAFLKVARLVMVGGSATTSRAVAEGGRMTDPYEAITRAELTNVIDRLAPLPLERRKVVRGMVAQRADILLAGVIVLDEACALTGHAEALVSTNDLLLGYLLRQ